MKDIQPIVTIELCMGSSCYCRGNNRLAVELKELIVRRSWDGKIAIRGCLCKDECPKGPNIRINGIRTEVSNISAFEKLIEQGIKAYQG
jgi:NADH:ubiquinone oxidoreductase subunit E